MPKVPVFRRRDETRSCGRFFISSNPRTFPGVPAKLFVRIAVRDEAGNQARAETEQPVLIDLTRPTARIVDVESIDAGTTPR